MSAPALAVAGRPRRRLHGAGAGAVLRPDPRGRPAAGAGDHLRQPRGRGAARRPAARRAVHPRHRARPAAGAGRLRPGHAAQPGPHARPRSCATSTRPCRDLSDPRTSVVAVIEERVRCAGPTARRSTSSTTTRSGARPLRGDDALFERLCLEAFQSGLSWITILRKRPAFRAAFAGFAIDAVADFTADDEARLMADAGIVRNRAKITAVDPQRPRGAGAARGAVGAAVVLRAGRATGRARPRSPTSPRPARSRSRWPRS